MAITLLDMLKNSGLITREQFDEALRNRVLFGGKIGTSLIELGHVHEDDLARFLSSKLAVPFVDPRRLLTIPPEIIGLIPRELALKYWLIPIQLDNKRLYVVMADPADLKAIDEVSFITGFIIKPLVAPEVRLIQALGKYYDYEIDYRYRHIIERIDREKPRRRQVTPAAGHVPPKKSPPLPEHPPVLENLALAEEPPVTVERVPPPPEQPPVPADFIPTPPAQETPPPSVLAPILAELPGEAPPPREAMPEPPAGDTDLEEAEVVDDEEWLKWIGHYSIDSASANLSRAEDREEIAGILMGYLGQEFDRAALFVIRGDAACGWRGMNRGAELMDFEKLVIRFDGPSVLRTVTQGIGYYLGTIPDTPMNALMIDGLGGGRPPAALLLPLIVMGRVVAILYVEGGQKSLDECFTELYRLLAKAALAFEILICREKILML